MAKITKVPAVQVPMVPRTCAPVGKPMVDALKNETPEDPGSVASLEAGPSLLRGSLIIGPPPLSSKEREKRRMHLTPYEQLNHE